MIQLNSESELSPEAIIFPFDDLITDVPMIISTGVSSDFDLRRTQDSVTTHVAPLDYKHIHVDKCRMVRAA